MDDRKITSSSCLQIREEGEDRFIVCSNEKGFETNSVGVRIIELCATGESFSGLVAKIVEEFDAPAEAVSSDLQMLIPEFIENGILVLGGEK